MSEKPLLIMDMDGVIVDVSASYREVVRLTVYTYLRQFIGAENISSGAVTLEDVSAVKKSGGLNNDWELTYAILNTILKIYFDGENAGALESVAELKGITDDSHLLRTGKLILETCNTTSLGKVGKTPLAEVYSTHERKLANYSPFLMCQGDVGGGNLVKRIFQELYLGGSLFRDTYRDAPLFYDGGGYIERERLIPAKKQLQELHESCALAIATGRPHSEAEYALVNFGIDELFRAMITEDDVAGAEALSREPLRKPYPFMIDLCIERCGWGSSGDIFYLGDMPDDMTAASRAGVVPLGFIHDGLEMDEDVREEHRSLLLQKGARKVFGNYREIIAYLKDFTEKKSR